MITDYLYWGVTGSTVRSGGIILMEKEVRGVAFEGEDIFVVLEGSCEIKVFNSTTLESKDSIFLADLSDPWDILALEGHIFVTETDRKSLFCMPDRQNWKEWPLSSSMATLSRTPEGTILVCCKRRLVEFDLDGGKIKQVPLKRIDGNPWRDSPLHAVKLSRMGYVVCDSRYQHHRIILLKNGGTPVIAYGEPAKLEKKPMRLPRYFVRYQNDFILVADQDNDRILMVSPDLEPVREFITASGDIRKPFRMCLDEKGKRLYVVGENQESVSVFILKLGISLFNYISLNLTMILSVNAKIINNYYYHLSDRQCF